MTLPISADDVVAAADRIKDHVHKTPVLTSTFIDELASTLTQKRRLLFKCEHLQKIGAFKIRGATNALLLTSAEDRAKGVVTHSSGNHAQALALAARQLGVKATIVMPSTSPQVKKDAVRGYGAKVVECEPTLEARETECQKIIDETGATFIHPYNDPRVMAGQGTQMLELLEQAVEIGRPLDAVLIPLGGGGMLSGCATAAKAVSPSTKVFGAEPQEADDAYRSFKSGEIQAPVPPKSVADGLLTALGPNTFAVIMDRVDDIFLVTEEQIIRAMKLVWERMKQVIEPSGAVGLAVALYNEKFRALEGISDIGVILCGGNVQLDRAMKLFANLDQQISPATQPTTRSVILLKTKSTPKDPYESEFMSRGYKPYFVPVLSHAMVNLADLQQRLSAIDQYSGLIVTSQRSVEAVADMIAALTTSQKTALLQKPVYTVGPATHAAISRIGFSDIRGSESGNGDALATFILRERPENEIRPFFFIVGDKRRDIITKRMAAAGIPLEELVVYETVTASTFISDFQSATMDAGNSIEWLVFFSPAGADVALEFVKRSGNRTRIATIGPTTYDYLVNTWSITPQVVSPKPEPVSLVTALVNHSV
ncbi:hypothetical protein PYCC9005_002383 [Savitreella phatthalungensis]